MDMEKNMNKIKIMRGIPGSGKSTYVRTNFADAEVCSADDYFMNPEGIYEFNREKLGEAHKQCMQIFLHAVISGQPLIVVDNTNIRFWEFAGYLQVGNAMLYEVEIIRIIADPEIAAARNTHGVPAGAIKHMHKRIEGVPAPWSEALIVGDFSLTKAGA